MIAVTELALEQQSAPWIVDRSAEAVRTGRAWSQADHEALIHTLRRIDGLVQEIQSRYQSALCGCKVRVSK
jgi:hypothetical protein